MSLISFMRTTDPGIRFSRIHRISFGIVRSILCALRPGAGLFLGRERHTRKGGPGSFLIAGLLSALPVAHLPSVIADECVGRILKMEPGKVRLRKVDGESVRIDSAAIETPLCVLEVVAELPRYRVFIPDGELKGVWLIKRRKVMEVEGALAVDCAPPVITMLETRKSDSGGYRASGEESCN